MQLVIENLSKKYIGSKNYALQDFSIQMKEGIYGLLGPNGTGKSTLMNIIVQAIKSDTGAIAFNGQKVEENSLDYISQIGFMPQQQNIYHDFTARRFLWYMAALKGLNKKLAATKIDELFAVVNLHGMEDQKLGSFSGGMKQRILIAQSLLNDPKILVLDEPTAGVDPQERVSLRNFIRTISGSKIVLLSTHVVSDIESTADSIICLKKGKLIEHTSPGDMIQRYNHIVWTCSAVQSQLAELQGKHLVSRITPLEDGSFSVRVINNDAPIGITSYITIPTLEEIYLYLYKE